MSSPEPLQSLPAPSTWLPSQMVERTLNELYVFYSAFQQVRLNGIFYGQVHWKAFCNTEPKQQHETPASQGAKNLAYLQYPTAHPHACDKEGGHLTPSWSYRKRPAGAAGHTLSHWAPSPEVLVLLAATSHSCHGTKLSVESEDRSRLQTDLCRALHEEDSYFRFLEWLSAFRGNGGAHVQQASGSGVCWAVELWADCGNRTLRECWQRFPQLCT